MGKAIVRCWKIKGGTQLPAAEAFRMIPGRGVSAQAEGKAVLAGNIALLTEAGVSMTVPEAATRYIQQGCTVTHVAIEGEYAGFIALSDTLRKYGEIPSTGR